MSGIRHCRTILFRIFDFVNSKRKCFVFHNLPILPRFGYFSLMSIFTYCLIIIPCWFCKFSLVNSKTKCALRDRILESKISVGVNLFISRSSSTRLNRHHIPRFGCFSLVSILTGIQKLKVTRMSLYERENPGLALLCWTQKMISERRRQCP